MIHESIVVGRVQCNCYILGCEKTREGIIIDPGGDADLIMEIVKKHNLSIRYIIATHGHFDHIEGLSDLVHSIKAPIMLHEGDTPLYNDLKGQGRIFGMTLAPAPPLDKTLKDGDRFSFGDYTIDVLHTPGHSPGSISLRCDSSVYTGDTVFAGSIGRTDLPGGSHDALIRSAKLKILSLDDATALHPGHGESTTVGYEKKFNPFLGEGRDRYI